MSDVIEAPLKYKKIKCAKCIRCLTSCPFDAISFVDRKLNIDLDKCQLCGICASICPAENIEMVYYDNKSLIDYIKRQKEELKTDNLVVMCRGSSPQSCDILDVLKSQNVDKFITLRLPCVGRLSLDFYLDALNSGIKKIVIIQCDDVMCRFKSGSIFSSNKFKRLHELLDEIGYEKDVVTLLENPLKALYETNDCVGCDKCVFICPYDAIEAQSLATPVINYEKCKGCGACALVCPHLAIQLEGFDYNSITKTIHDYKIKIEQKKSNGISPIILVFSCKWAEFTELEDDDMDFYKENVVLIEIPCVNALDPVQVLEAFQSGFDGVLAVVCKEDDCRSKEGRDIAEGNIKVLEKVLKSLDIKDRFELCHNSPKNTGEFDKIIESFITKISILPKISLEGWFDNV